MSYQSEHDKGNVRKWIAGYFLLENSSSDLLKEQFRENQ